MCEAKKTETTAEGFEIKTCGRCGGCGQYSYCQMYGSTCFGCRGTGKIYTKRGGAALKFYNDSLMVPANTIQPGDTIKTWHGGKFSKVLKVGPQNDGGGRVVNGEIIPGYTIETVAESYTLCGPTDLVRKGYSAADKAPKLAAAMAYQATLTKMGKPMKRKAQAAA